jgi:hypothetical protein
MLHSLSLKDEPKRCENNTFNSGELSLLTALHSTKLFPLQVFAVVTEKFFIFRAESYLWAHWSTQSECNACNLEGNTQEEKNGYVVLK